MVLLGYTNLFRRTNQWQDRARYEIGAGEVVGFRQVSEREGGFDLVLYYAKTASLGTRQLFESLFERFLSGRKVSITKYPPLVCSQCGYQQDRGEVKRRMIAKRTFDTAPSAVKELHPTGGEQLATPDSTRETVAVEATTAERKTFFEVALVRVKAALRDLDKDVRDITCFVSYAWGERLISSGLRSDWLKTSVRRESVLCWTDRAIRQLGPMSADFLPE